MSNASDESQITIDDVIAAELPAPSTLDEVGAPEGSLREACSAATTAKEQRTPVATGKRAREQEAALPVPGEVIAGRYRLEREIGRGGMGVVYAAVQLNTGRAVAIKWLFEGVPARPERKRRFMREARAASAIEHRNVVRVFDAGEHGHGVFCAMELLTGEPLRAYLQRENLGIAQAIDLLMPVLRGIAAAHAHGVIHRDLKPENLFLHRVNTSTGAGPDAALDIKVLDFGLSKLVGPDADSLHTLPGAMLGTPQYMAPEQVEGSSHADGRCDQYAMATMLYEAIAGRRPFEALTLPGLLAKIARDEPPSLIGTARAFGKEVPPELSAAIMRALQRDRDKRFATIEDFAMALEPFGTLRFHLSDAARSAYLSTRPPPPALAPAALAQAAPAQGRPVRSRRAIAIAALGLLSLVTLVAFGLYGLRDEPPNAAPIPVASAATISEPPLPTPAAAAEPLAPPAHLEPKSEQTIPALQEAQAAPPVRALAPRRELRRPAATAAPPPRPPKATSKPSQAPARAARPPKHQTGVADPWDD